MESPKEARDCVSDSVTLVNGTQEVKKARRDPWAARRGHTTMGIYHDQ
jgi:hypothetical protein